MKMRNEPATCMYGMSISSRNFWPPRIAFGSDSSMSIFTMACDKQINQTLFMKPEANLKFFWGLHLQKS